MLPIVQSRLRAGMVIAPEVVLRQRSCHRRGCGIVFWICRSCDRGQRYCSNPCRLQARREQCRAANRRHQNSVEGRLDHRERQRSYRRRLGSRACVTDQASPVHVSDGRIPPPTIWLVAYGRSWAACRRGRARHGQLLCSVCGRAGRFVDTFPKRR